MTGLQVVDSCDSQSSPLGKQGSEDYELEVDDDDPEPEVDDDDDDKLPQSLKVALEKIRKEFRQTEEEMWDRIAHLENGLQLVSMYLISKVCTAILFPKLDLLISEYQDEHLPYFIHLCSALDYAQAQLATMANLQGHKHANEGMSQIWCRTLGRSAMDKEWHGKACNLLQAVAATNPVISKLILDHRAMTLFVTTRYGLLHYDYLIRRTGPFIFLPTYLI